MWKKILEWGRPQATIWRMRVACWRPKATNTLRLCNTHCFLTATTVARTGLSITLCVQCLSCSYLIPLHCSSENPWSVLPHPNCCVSQVMPVTKLKRKLKRLNSLIEFPFSPYCQGLSYRRVPAVRSGCRQEW